jgi:hypothetical protein
MDWVKGRVKLNIYDYSGVNCCLGPLGLGLYHSGVEIEWRAYQR